MPTRASVCLALLMAAVLGTPPFAAGQAPATPPTRIAPPDDFGQQFPSRPAGTLDTQTGDLIRVRTARTQFGVDGAGLTIAVLDTGLRTTHVDFAGKVAAVRNFTTDDGGNPNIVTDGHGHGTNVAGIAVGNGVNVGIAPGARVIPLKVLTNSGSGSFSDVTKALDWVLQNRSTYNITAVNLSLGDGGNYTSDPSSSDSVRQRFASLRTAGVAVCVAAGNSFYNLGSRQGMGYPAICRESISVGAVYDANLGRVSYGGGAIAYSTGPKRITPFSQRLHATINSATRTDIFVPGAALTAAGIANDTAASTYHGTSQASPVAAGLCLLAQQYALKKVGRLPTVDQLERWLANTSTAVGNLLTDGDDEDDNVSNTQQQFAMADAVLMLSAAEAELSGGSSGGDGGTAPPTGRVTASYNSSTRTLTLTGDANPSSLNITRQSSSRVLIAAATGTTINGTSSVSYTISGSFTLRGDLGAGNNNISMTSLSLSLLDLKLGDGTDRLTLSYCTIGTCRADGGPGTDMFISSTSSIQSNQNTGFP